ncbi:MFS transporter [Novosphingobium sp. Fuku2-ISO-50]|uniref:MFS transporter n=1 Tax=Novosphingobium sp. Fuku2-ISO-50 TaxID=1739114 RepID=UPI00076C239A|nr:MFS transporter [Novosphingobium sp. Fuku2-ISO-50]KUR76675.1 MFS transporter [Novosphingobium sp. Fuku2-ISO-50]
MTHTTVISGYRWYVLAALTLAQTCHGLDRAVIGLVLKPIGSEFHLTGAQLGLLAGLAYGLPFALAAIPFGYAADRFTRKSLLTGALLAWSGATALCAMTGGYAGLLGGRAAVGLAEAGGSPTGLSILSDYFGADRRSTAIGIWYLSSGIGFAVAFFVGGMIVANHGWRITFLVAGLPGLLVAPLVFLTVKEPRRGALDRIAGTLSKETLAHRLRLLFARPGIAWGVLAITCIATGIYGMSTWLVTYLVDSHAMSLPRAGMIVAIAYGLLGSVGGLGAGWGVDRVHARAGGFDSARTAWIGAGIPVVTAITGLAAVSAPSSSAAVAWIMAAGMFSAAYNGPVNAMIVTQAGPQLRGLAVACVQTSANLIGVGLGAWLIGKVSDVVGGRNGVAWGIGAAMIFCLFGGVFLMLAACQIRAHAPAPDAY